LGREGPTFDQVAGIDSALLNLTAATQADVPAIAALMSLAFRAHDHGIAVPYFKFQERSLREPIVAIAAKRHDGTFTFV
jgi:hypothetical protein